MSTRDDAEPRRPRRVNAGGDAGSGSNGGTKPRKVWRGAPGKAASNQGSREVIVRVTGRTKSVQNLGAQFKYFSRNGSLPVEHSHGRILRGIDDLYRLRDGWAMDNSVLARHPSCNTQSVCVVLSMPAGTDAETVQKAVQAWAHRHITPKTEWLAVLHTDRGHPHVHCAIRAVQDDGFRVAASPADLRQWRETFAGELRTRGVEAYATPQWEKLERRRTRADERAEHGHDRPVERTLPALGVHSL